MTERRLAMRADDVSALANPQADAHGAALSWGDDLACRLITRQLGGPLVGRLDLTLPGGTRMKIGTSTRAATAELRIMSFRALLRIGQRGTIGFAEAYMAGEAETEDLGGLFRFCLDNEDALWRPAAPLTRSGLGARLRHKLRANTRGGSRRNIAAHYDLGNAFYAHWLDAGMTYSSGIYRSQDATLEAAQAAKYSAIVDALELAPNQTLLEIGCGWGGLAEAAARSDAQVTALTISRAQEAYARQRLADAGLAARVDVRFQDYRDASGAFDRIASIEMIEAVGEENWPTYFRLLNDRLRPGGVAVLQAITIADRYFESYRRNTDFIQRYIFPGGMLPTVPLMAQHARDAGLAFETVERFGTSYARTLVDWRHRFEVAWPALQELGFDARFRRLWRLYLVYCEVGFERGMIDVGLYRLRKPT